MRTRGVRFGKVWPESGIYGSLHSAAHITSILFIDAGREVTKTFFRENMTRDGDSNEACRSSNVSVCNVNATN